MSIANVVRLLLLAAIWGGSFLFIRIGVPVFGPARLIELRVAIAAAFLWLVCRYLGRALEWRRHWRHYLLTGLLNSALPFLLFAHAAQTLSASLLSILNSTTPMFGALVAAVWLRQRIGAATAGGLALGMAGVAVVVAGGVAVKDSAWVSPVLASLAAPLCYAIASVYTKRVGVAVDPTANAHGSLWAATLLLLPLALLYPAPGVPRAGDWTAVTALGILCTGVAFLMYFRLLDEVGPLPALSVTFLIPVFGVLWGVLLLGEEVGWHTLAGGVMVLLGTALTTGLLRGRRR